MTHDNTNLPTATCLQQTGTLDSVECLELIQQTAVDAKGAVNKLHIIELDSDVPIRLAVKPDGSYEKLPYPSPDRCHHATTLADFAHYVKTAAQEGASPTIWFDVSLDSLQIEVMAILDDEAGDIRRHKVYCTIRATPEFALLKEKIHERGMQPKSLLRWLRNHLDGCCETSTAKQLVKSLQAVNFESGEVARTASMRGQESLGLDITAKASSQVGDIPEVITLQVPLFDDPWIDARQDVRCNIDILPSEKSVELIIVPDSLRRCLRDTLGNVGHGLAGVVSWNEDEKLPAANTYRRSIPVYRGRP